MVARLLVISYGSIGKRHLRNARTLLPGAQLAVLRRPTSLGAGPQPPHDVAVLTSLPAALEWKPQAAVVCSPAPFHLEQAEALAASGVHLLIEKPLATDRQDPGPLHAAVQRAGVTALLGYTLRFHAPLVDFHAAWTSGAAGEGRYLRASVGMHLPDWRPSQPLATQVSAQRALGGGALLELSHEIDLVTWLWGPPSRVWARTASLGGWGLDVEDLAELTLRWADGRVASIHLDMLDRTPHRSLRLVGSEATLSWSLAEGGRAPGPDMYLAQMAHFWACIRGDETPRCTLADGALVMRIVAAARRSAASGREEPV